MGNQFGIMLLPWNKEVGLPNISLKETMTQQDANTFQRNIQFYEDYLRVNKIDIPFAKH